MAAEQFVFTVDKNQRKEKRRKIAAVSRTVRVLNLLGIIINIAAAAFILIWGTISKNAFTYLDYDGKKEKDLLVLLFVFVGSQFILWFLFWAMQVIFDKAIYPEIGERVQESLNAGNNVLVYGYRNRWGNPDTSRVIVTIPLDRVKYEVNEAKCEVIFHGQMNSTYYDTYHPGKRTANLHPNIDSFIIVDFFSPSLIKWLGEGH